MYIDARKSTKDLSIHQQSGTIDGKFHGIKAFNHGTGSTQVTLAGAITASAVDPSNNNADAEGVVNIYSSEDTTDFTFIQEAGSVISSDKVSALVLHAMGTGKTSIETSGDVIASEGGIGISVLSYETAQDLIINQLTGTIKGGQMGVLLERRGGDYNFRRC